MKISLIITTYNNPFFLGKVMRSILVQSRLPDELIIADDGSGNDTASVVRDFSKIALFPVTHVWQEHKGFRAAKIRNEAIKKTSGDYIILLDGDCVANRHFISDHISLLEEGCFIQGKRVHVRKNAVSYFCHEHVNSTISLVGMTLRGRLSNVHHLIRCTLNIFSVKNRNLKGIKSCNMSFFRKDILAVNGFNEDFIGWGSEDSELATRFFKYGLLKKTHPFMAICFHLWHPPNKPLDNRNKALLLSSLSSEGFFCSNGIFKKDQS